MATGTPQERVYQLRLYQSLPLETKIQMTKARIREWYNHFGGDVYVAFSGGKDSTVLLDLVWQDYPEVPAVFANTGNELESVLEFVRGYGDRVLWVEPQMTYEQVVAKYGYPVVSKRVSDYVHRVKHTQSDQVRRRHLKGENADGTPSPASKIPTKWQHLLKAPFDTTTKCCGILKFGPTSEYAKATGRKPFVGTMAADSENRKNSYLNHGGCNAYDQQDQQSRPMAFWVEQDVLTYIRDRRLPVAGAYWGERCGHPALLKEDEDGTLHTCGDSRTGCKFCLFGIHMEKGENRIQRLAYTEPESYRHAVEDLHYDKVMEYIGVEWRPLDKEGNVLGYVPEKGKK